MPVLSPFYICDRCMGGLNDVSLALLKVISTASHIISSHALRNMWLWSVHTQLAVVFIGVSV